MLEEDPKERPNAKKVRKRCQQALKRATRSSAAEIIAFPPAFRLESEATAQPQTPQTPQTPQEVPYPPSHHGLGIEGSSQIHFQTTKSPAATGHGARNSRCPPHRSKSLISGQDSIDTMLINQPATFGSPGFKDFSTGTGAGPSHHRAPAHVSWPTESFASPTSPDPAIRNTRINNQSHLNPQSTPLNNHRESYNETSVARDKEMVPVSHRDSGDYEKEGVVEVGPRATIEEVHGLIQKKKGRGSTDLKLDELRRLPSLQKRDQVRTLREPNKLFLTESRYFLSTTRSRCKSIGHKFAKHSRFLRISSKTLTPMAWNCTSRIRMHSTSRKTGRSCFVFYAV
jgi:hypothetical protein